MRRCSTWRAITSRNDNPRRTHSSDLARSIPIEVPSPPLSLMTAVVRIASAACSSETSTSASASMSSGSIEDSGIMPGLAVLEQAEVVSEGLDRDLVHARAPHLVEGVLQTWTTHASIVGLPCARPAIPLTPGRRSGSPAHAAKVALRDQLLTGGTDARSSRWGRRPRDRRARARPRWRYAGRRRWRRTPRSAPSRARSALLEGLVAMGSGWCSRCCCRTSTSTGRSTAAPTR